ncbi:MAG: hypothetical protein J6U54_16645 [Clostridiales bacterium]|nr:hypothetical protein [Clostridiales bacterium]
MVISVGHNNIDCKSYEDYSLGVDRVLSSSDAEIWISETGRADEFPCLAILINNDLAFINYFDGEKNLASVAPSSDEGYIKFCGGAYEVRKDQIIPKDQAGFAIKEFYESCSPSDLIDWEVIA